MRMFFVRYVLSAMLLLAAGTGYAKIESVEFENQQMQEDYNVLINELRCLVCQNQNLADSNAELAQDLRHQVVEQLQQGKSREDIVEYMVARYGDFVMYRPPVKGTTLLLWFGPLVFLLVAATVVIVFVRRQKQKVVVDVPEQEKSKAHSLLGD